MLPKNVQMMWPKDVLTQGLAVLTNALRMVWAHNRNQGILGCSLKKLLLIIITTGAGPDFTTLLALRELSVLILTKSP